MTSLNPDIAKCAFSVENFAECDTLRYSAFFSPPRNSQIQFELFLSPQHSIPLCDGSYAFIFLYLHKCDVDELPVRYRISIVNATGERCNTQEGLVKYNFKGKFRYNGLYHVSRAYLLEPSNGLLVDGNLKIDCEVEIIDPKNPTPSPSNLLKPRDAILEDYQSLLESNKFSDITLLVGEKKLPAHKAILSARSPVFGAMFDHATKEQTEGMVTITDVSLEVFQDLLRYIYTGRVQSLDRYAVELLEAADKYQLTQLKSLCEQSLSSNLSTDSVAQVLLLADMHQAKQLKSKCMDYIIDMAEIVMVTEGWKSLTATAKPELAFELFQSVVSKLLNKHCSI